MNNEPISFSDYKRDMDELSAQAAVVVERQLEKIKNLQRMINVLVYAAGGKISVPDGDFAYPPDIFECWRDEANACMVYVSRKKPHRSK